MKKKKTYRNKMFTVIGVLAMLVLAVGALFSTDAVVGISTAGLFLFPIMRNTSADDVAGETPEEKEKRLLLEAVEKRVKSIGDGAYTTKAELGHLAAKLDKLAGDENVTIKELKENITGLSAVVKAIQEHAKAPEATENIKDQITKWVEANKDDIALLRKGQKPTKGMSEMVIKLNSPMTPSNTYNGSAYLPQPEFEAGATEIVRVQPTFWDYIRKGRTSSAAYVWVNKKNPEGAAGFIGPGVAKPGISFEIGTEISVAKKIAASEKCATELLEDIEGMQSWIEMELMYQLRQKTNTTLMTGVTSATVPAGIQTLSTTYTLTGVETTNANNYDAIIALVAQLRSGSLMGPVTVFLNPVDIANMKIAKAVSQGQYLNSLPDLGVTIVEDNNIPVGYVQAALLDYYRILIYKDITIFFGTEMDDLTKNLVTGICEMRLHQFFSENHTGSFIYDTLENIKTAITAP